MSNLGKLPRNHRHRTGETTVDCKVLAIDIAGVICEPKSEYLSMVHVEMSCT